MGVRFEHQQGLLPADELHFVLFSICLQVSSALHRRNQQITELIHFKSSFLLSACSCSDIKLLPFSNNELLHAIQFVCSCRLLLPEASLTLMVLCDLFIPLQTVLSTKL
jgi:hypothetical protein